jgi:hypothetical protein
LYQFMRYSGLQPRPVKWSHGLIINCLLSRSAEHERNMQNVDICAMMLISSSTSQNG